MAEPPEDSLSFAKRMFGVNPFPKDDSRHELWEKICRIWAEKDARVTAELLEKHPTNLQNPLPILELVTGRFNIGAECFLAFMVWNYESVARYEQILGKLMDSWLSLTREHCPRGIEKTELLFQLELRLTGRMAHWRAEALRLARESQVKRPVATANLDVNRTLQEGQQALEDWAAIRDSLSSEARDSAQKPELPQPLPASVTNGSDPLQVGSDATADQRVKAVFRKSGELWEIGYEDKTLNFRDRKAFHFISKLLRERGKKIPARELAAQVSPGSEGVANGAKFTSEAAREGQVSIRDSLGVGGGGDVDDKVDGLALRQYRERLVTNSKEREVAKENQDSARLAELNKEADQIEQEINAATGHGGKIRKFVSPEDRARSNVTMQIKAAIQKISDQNPELGSHLHQTIKTGMDFSYQPDSATDIRWNL